MKICSLCGGTTYVFFNQKHKMNMCRNCRNEIQANNGELLTTYPKPGYGEVTFSPDGKPICHICGKAFKKVLSHVHQRHGLSAKEYKHKFGLDVKKGLTAESTKNKLRIAVNEHYDLVVTRNLIIHGEKSRFTPGSQGRTIDKCSAQTMQRLKYRLWNGKFIKKQELGAI